MREFPSTQNMTSVAVVDCGEDDEQRLLSLSKAVPTQVFRGAPRDADELVRRADGADVLVTLYTYTQVNATVLERLPGVRLVATRTAGFSHIDVECAARLGVRVAVVPSAATRSVAEYVFGALLAAQRGLFAARDATRAGSWAYQDHQGFELAGSTLGVVGLGAIGQQVAEIGRALDMRVLGWTRRTREINGVEMVELDDLLRQADVVSLSVALNNETRDLLGQRELALMKPRAWLVNAARGGILDEDELVRRLRAGTLAGAILDVLDGEPPAAERLAELRDVPNLLVTPHIAWHTEAALKRQFDETTQNVLAFLRGEEQNLIPSPTITPTDVRG